MNTNDSGFFAFFPGDLVRFVPTIEKAVLRRQPTYDSIVSRSRNSCIVCKDDVFLVINVISLRHEFIFSKDNREHVYVVCSASGLTGWGDSVWFEKA